MQGVLGAAACPGAAARGAVTAVSRVWHSPEPDEPQYLHDLRVDVHEGDASPQDHHRRDDHVRHLRDYTSLSQSLSPDVISALLDTFYDECASAIWEYDGLLNKTIGDAVMAVFNFPLKRTDHARRAVLAAVNPKALRCQARGVGRDARSRQRQARGRHRGAHRRAQLWGVRPITSRPDRDRRGGEHGLPGAIGRRSRRNSRHARRPRQRAIGFGRRPGQGVHAQGIRGSGRALRSLSATLQIGHRSHRRADRNRGGDQNRQRSALGTNLMPGDRTLRTTSLP